MKENNLIKEELDLAGEVSPISPLVVQLDKYRIMSDTPVPAEDFLLRMFGKPCFPRRDLSTITGLEKCGKTFFTSMLMACCVKDKVLQLERNTPNTSDTSSQPSDFLRVMWYDTEQSRQSTKEILKNRVYGLVNNADIDSHFFVFNVRACTYQERMDYLVAGIEAYKPDMVIIDNVSDLGIKQPKYYEKVYNLAVEQRVVQTTMDRNGRIVVMLIPQ